MKKSQIPFYIFLLLFMLTIPLSFNKYSLNFATSVVPGWHTTILPPYFFMNIVVSIILLLVTIAYRKLSKRTKPVNWLVFIIHFTLTIPVTLYILFPSFIDNLLFKVIQQNERVNFSWMIILVFAPYIMFMAGQVLFAIFYFKQKCLRSHPVSQA